MILSDFLKALAQLSDRRFRAVLWRGAGLALVLLALVFAAFLVTLRWLVPESVTLPLIGEVGGIGAIVSWASVPLMLLSSVFLMGPVAVAFTGLFLDEVAAAVEARHYPALPPARGTTLAEGIADSLGLFGLMVLVTIAALLLGLFAGPFLPLVFWAVNGFLLGREYFQVAAMRRLGRDGARALCRRYPGRIWLAGILMAAPLSVPVVNLLVPVIGAATFTHLFHRLAAEAAPAPASRDR